MREQPATAVHKSKNKQFVHACINKMQNTVFVLYTNQIVCVSFMKNNITYYYDKINVYFPINSLTSNN